MNARLAKFQEICIKIGGRYILRHFCRDRGLPYIKTLNFIKFGGNVDYFYLRNMRDCLNKSWSVDDTYRFMEHNVWNIKTTSQARNQAQSKEIAEDDSKEIAQENSKVCDQYEWCWHHDDRSDYPPEVLEWLDYHEGRKEIEGHSEWLEYFRIHQEGAREKLMEDLTLRFDDEEVSCFQEWEMYEDSKRSVKD